METSRPVTAVGRIQDATSPLEQALRHLLPILAAFCGEMTTVKAARACAVRLEHELRALFRTIVTFVKGVDEAFACELTEKEIVNWDQLAAVMEDREAMAKAIDLQVLFDWFEAKGLLNIFDFLQPVLSDAARHTAELDKINQLLAKNRREKIKEVCDIAQSMERAIRASLGELGKVDETERFLLEAPRPAPGSVEERKQAARDVWFAELLAHLPEGETLRLHQGG